MDTLNFYRKAIEDLLQDYIEYLGSNPDTEVSLAIDRERDRYLLIEIGWEQNKRIYGTFIHIDIIDGKLWIQHDGTEVGIADELVAAGIPKQSIVLAYRSLDRRRVTDFAIM